MENETLVNFGGAVKAVDTEKIGGYLVKFSDANAPDLAGDFFTKDTDFGIVDGDKTAVYLNHRAPMKTADGKRVAVREQIGEGTLKTADDGILIETILYNRKEYEAALEAMSWSSGTASHLVDREKKGNATWVKTWKLKLDASMTPRPCQPVHTAVTSLKSYLEAEEVATKKEEPKEAVKSGAKVEEETKTVAVIAKPMKTIFQERLAAYRADASKGLVAEELAERQTGYYELGCALREVATDIANASAASDITGVKVDVLAVVTAAVMEYATLLIPNIVTQINDFVEEDDENYFYLKTFATGTVFNSLTDKDGSPRTGLRMQEHSETVLTAARELGKNAEATFKAAEALAQRFDGKEQLDIKAGRVLSATNRERIKKHAGEVMAAKDQLHAVAGSLMDLYNKTDPIPKEEPKSADETLMQQLVAGWTQQSILHTETV